MRSSFPTNQTNNMVFLETLIRINIPGRTQVKWLRNRGDSWHHYGIKVEEQGDTTRVKRDGETGARVIDTTGSDQVFIMENREHVGTIHITHPRNS